MQTGLFCILFYILVYYILYLLYSRRELKVVKCSWAGNTLWVCFHWLQIRALISLKLRSGLGSVLGPSCGFWCHCAPTASLRDTNWQCCLTDKSVHGLICSMNCYHCHVPEQENTNHGHLAPPGAISRGITASIPSNFLSQKFCPHEHHFLGVYFPLLSFDS